jgi:hypothetical protein
LLANEWQKVEIHLMEARQIKIKDLHRINNLQEDHKDLGIKHWLLELIHIYHKVLKQEEALR